MMTIYIFFFSLVDRYLDLFNFFCLFLSIPQKSVLITIEREKERERKKRLIRLLVNFTHEKKKGENINCKPKVVEWVGGWVGGFER